MTYAAFIARLQADLSATIGQTDYGYLATRHVVDTLTRAGNYFWLRHLFFTRRTIYMGKLIPLGHPPTLRWVAPHTKLRMVGHTHFFDATDPAYATPTSYAYTLQRLTGYPQAVCSAWLEVCFAACRDLLQAKERIPLPQLGTISAYLPIGQIVTPYMSWWYNLKHGNYYPGVRWPAHLTPHITLYR